MCIVDSTYSILYTYKKALVQRIFIHLSISLHPLNWSPAPRPLRARSVPAPCPLLLVYRFEVRRRGCPDDHLKMAHGLASPKSAQQIGEWGAVAVSRGKLASENLKERESVSHGKKVSHGVRLADATTDVGGPGVKTLVWQSGPQATCASETSDMAPGIVTGMIEQVQSVPTKKKCRNGFQKKTNVEQLACFFHPKNVQVFFRS